MRLVSPHRAVISASTRALIPAALFLFGCSLQPSSMPPASPPARPVADQFQEAIARREIVVGMEAQHVRESWGTTGCAFQDIFEGQPAEAWGYGRDSKTGEVVGIEDCNEASTVIYVVNGTVAGWGTKD